MKDILNIDGVNIGGLDDAAIIDNTKAQATQDTDLVEMDAEQRKQLTKEQELDVGDSVRKITEVAEGLQMLLLNADGTPKDLTDIQGRNELVRQIKLYSQSERELLNKLTKESLASIPKSVQVQFSDGDRIFLNALSYLKWKISIGLAVLVIFSVLMLYAGIVKIGDAHNESVKAQAIVEQADLYAAKHRILATFGNYMRKNNPKTWDKFQNDKEFRTEVFKEYDVNAIDKK